MKINGKPLDAAILEVLVIPRSSGDIVFKAQPVTSYAEFDAVCTIPLPGKIRHKGGAVEDDLKDPAYIVRRNDYNKKKTDFLFIKSLQATDGLEWSKVDMQNADTWYHWQDELKDGGFSDLQIGMICDIVISACGLDDKKITEATKRFLAGQEAALKEQLSLASEQVNTPSGEAASA